MAAKVIVTTEDMSRARGIARHASSGRPWLFDDCYSAAALALAKAALAYDGRGTWEGYSGSRMRWAALDEIKRLVGRGAAQAIKSAISLDALREDGFDVAQ